MKNQYVGDVGDYGKYSMLRAFAEEGIRVGVNWYLTEDDGSNDGKFTSYLGDESMRRRCPEVFDELEKIAFDPGRSVDDIQKSGIIPDAIFFNDLLKAEGTPSERKQKRSAWFTKSLDKLKDADLIFMDSDNGLLKSNDASKPEAEKYVLPDEVEMFFNAGHDVVYYCHKGRRRFEAWQDYLSLMFERIPAAKPAVLTYHKGSQRSYVFLIHEESFVKYRSIIDRILSRWFRIFSEEYTNMGDVTAKTLGEPFKVTKSDGTVVTIEKRVDGRIMVKSSTDPNTGIIVTTDSFCADLGF